MTELKKSDFKTIFSYLEQLFPNADTELNYETPFQLLVAVILSAQTTDKQVNKVTATLFQTIKQPEDVLKLGHPAFEQAIKSIGLYKGKAKNIYQTSELLLAKKGKIPKTTSELIKLPVQTKTPLQTSKLLETVIPNKYKQIAHHCIILF